MTAPEPQSAISFSSSILERVRSHDSDAWDRLNRLYTPIVTGWVLRAGVSPANTPDVVQDVFLEIVRSIERFRRDHDGGTFTGWVRVIARRRIADHFRRRSEDPDPAGGTAANLMLQQLPDVQPASSILTDDDAPAAEIIRRGIDLIRDEFEERTWTAFVKTAVESKSTKDVAEALGMSVGAVYVARSRVTKRLREELDGLV